MSTAHRISDALNVHPMGDLEKYFEFLSNMIEMNSGTNDYKMVTHDSYALSVPVPENQTTKFRITDSSMDIVDISQGYIVLSCEMTLIFKTKDKDDAAFKESVDYPGFKDLVYFFVGFKSGAQIIDSYNVYSNGRVTACKQTKGTSEQAIVLNCKAREERKGRPGMYSVHSDVLKMRDCVCGVYIAQPSLETMTGGSNGMPIKFDVVIQIDDLLPFSAMTAFPRFKCGELELEIKANLRNNMVFCQVPIEEVLKARPIPINSTSVMQFETDVYNTAIKTINTSDNWTMGNFTIDSRFHQCGDYARCLLGFSPKGTSAGSYKPNDCYVTIEPGNLVIKDAKSYVHGYNITEDAKDTIAEIIDRDEGLMIPAQWIDQTTFAQLPANTKLSMNTIVSLFECSQVIITFPNSANQLTVSRNPALKSVKCQIGDKMIPSKNMSTLDRAHAEMCLTALGLDSLFTAPKSLVNAYTTNGAMNRTNNAEDARALLDNYHWRLKREDDSDYMFVCDLERNSAGTYADGITAINCAISFDGEMENGSNNHHYYEFNPIKDTYLKDASEKPNYSLKQYAPLLFTVSDAYWIFNEYGGEFIKDQTTTAIRRKINDKAFAKADKYHGIANPESHYNPDNERNTNKLYNQYK